MPERIEEFGLALGGGAARGIAHIGVLKVLQANDIEPSFICGTSAGSIVGSLYAGGFHWETILEVIRTLDWGDMVNPVFPKLGLVSAKKLEERLEELLGPLEFDELDIPFCAVAVDLMTREQVQLCSGPVARAVRASCSIPGIFEPVELGDQVLVDGGVLNDVPVDVTQSMGAKVVLGVDLNADMDKYQKPDTLFKVLMASFAVMKRNVRPDIGKSDSVLVVSPDLSGHNYYDLKKVDELLDHGAEAAEQIMPDLKKLLKIK
jgi:NTE family protein